MEVEYLTKQLNSFIQEMVDCDIERYIEDVVINNTSAVFYFKKNTPKNLIKILQVLYKKRITVSIKDGKWRIAF